jgi:hypothetical protein
MKTPRSKAPKPANAAIIKLLIKPTAYAKAYVSVDANAKGAWLMSKPAMR